ncbi:MAG: cbb3-type cytochrome oxidase assembly protein [Thermoleophilia bacterium]
MSTAAIAQLAVSVVIFLIFLGFLIWGIRTGQFRDVEEAKYRIFDDDEGIKPEGNQEKTK